MDANANAVITAIALLVLTYRRAKKSELSFLTFVKENRTLV